MQYCSLQHWTLLSPPDTSTTEKRLRSGSKNTQRKYTKKKVLITWITMMVWSLNTEPDVLECEVKWALESVTVDKDNRGDRIPAELFQILKDDAIKVLHSLCQQILETQQWPQYWKSQFSFQSQRKAMPKNVQTTI